MYFAQNPPAVSKRLVHSVDRHGDDWLIVARFGSGAVYNASPAIFDPVVLVDTLNIIALFGDLADPMDLPGGARRRILDGLQHQYRPRTQHARAVRGRVGGTGFCRVAAEET